MTAALAAAISGVILAGGARQVSPALAGEGFWRACSHAGKAMLLPCWLKQRAEPYVVVVVGALAVTLVAVSEEE
ncbi:hypothetical protein [Thermogemmatispora sp.]|uniref:hypothetical protein n=1 Tax=Thermogemmatispora sp. TaxID=1968838 RepID=UPI001E02FC44|nr:hypothetical protein [Thermogemmatispora sp.]MBX5451332.1 hypothetical protein [Thermogemmatispora sp.]